MRVIVPIPSRSTSTSSSFPFNLEQSHVKQKPPPKAYFSPTTTTATAIKGRNEIMRPQMPSRISLPTNWIITHAGTLLHNRQRSSPETTMRPRNESKRAAINSSWQRASQLIIVIVFLLPPPPPHPPPPCNHIIMNHDSSIIVTDSRWHLYASQFHVINSFACCVAFQLPCLTNGDRIARMTTTSAIHVTVITRGRLASN